MKSFKHILRIGTFGLGASVWLCTAVAAAHHPVRASGLSTVVPQSRMDVDVEAASFDRQGDRGSWMTTALALEMAPHPRFSINLLTTLAWLRAADGAQVTGPGDSGLGITGTVWTSGDGRLALQLGLMSELPTGSVEDRLGSGHYELIPRISMQWTPDDAWMLSAFVADQFAVASAGAGDAADDGHDHSHDHGSHGSVHGSALAPHADHEMHVRATAAYRWRLLYASAGTQFTLMWTGSERLGPWLLQPEVGVLPSEHVRLSWGMELPLAGQARNQWLMRLGGAYLF